MPTIEGTGRSKTVETITKETLPLDDGRNSGLGMGWQDFFETASDEVLEITVAKFYRMASPGSNASEGYICRSGGEDERGDRRACERIDEEWIQRKFGGGIFNMGVRVKDGRSAFVKGIKTLGEPKLTEREKSPAAAAPAAAAVSSSNGDTSARILELLERTIERLENSKNPPPSQSSEVRTHAEMNALDIVTDAAKKAAGLTSAVAPAANTIGDQLTLVKQLLEIARPAPPVEDEFTRAIKAATLKRLTDPMPAGAGGGLVEQLGALQKVAEMMGWNKGTGKMGWMELAALAVEKGPEIIAKASEISAHGAQIAQENRVRTQVAAAAAADFQRGGPAPAVAGPRPAAPEAPVHTIAKPAPQPGPGGIRMAPLDGPPPASAGAAPMAPAEITDPPAPGMDTKSPAFLDFVKRRVVEMVRDETDGAGIVDFLVGCQQQDMVALLESSSPEQITQFLQRDPILQWAVKDPGWQRTLAEVKKYLREEGPPVQ